MAAYQGAATRAQRAVPLTSLQRVSTRQSRCHRRKSVMMSPGSSTPMGPLVSTARAALAYIRYQKRGLFSL